MSRIAVAREQIELVAMNAPPAIRQRLRTISTKYLYRIVRHTSAKRKIHKQPTPKQVLAVREFKKTHPGWNEGDIGRHFGLVNSRAVSYILHGNADGEAMFDRLGILTGAKP